MPKSHWLSRRTFFLAKHLIKIAWHLEVQLGGMTPRCSPRQRRKPGYDDALRAASLGEDLKVLPGAW